MEQNHLPYLMEDIEFPGYTIWEDRYACCCNIKYIPALDVSFFGHWEIKLIIPFLVLLLSISSYIIFLTLILPAFKEEKYYLFILMTILFFYYIYCYLRIIIDGPGYFPFYWNYKFLESSGSFSIDSNNFNNENSISGIISTEAQMIWAKQQPKPPRSILSKSARRIILRPDHLCGWTATWIGKRNHKFFLLFNFYCLIYLIIFLYYDARYLSNVIISNLSIELKMVFGISGFIAISFVLMTASFCISSCLDAINNRTSWEQWNGIEPKKFDKGWINNLEDIFGSKNNLIWWLCPYSPWIGKSNSELASQYISYYD